MCLVNVYICFKEHITNLTQKHTETTIQDIEIP